MEKINNLIKIPNHQERKKGEPLNARQYAIEDAVKTINERTDKYKTNYWAIKRKTDHLSLFDLQWHIQECKKTDNFSLCFYGKLKPKQLIKE